MHNSLSERINIAKNIFQTEGFISLVKALFLFLRETIFQYKTWYVYERPVIGFKEIDTLPNYSNLVDNIIYTNEQAEQLVTNGLEDFRKYFIKASKLLNGGAIVFCTHIDNKLAVASWLALDEDSKNLFKPSSFKVDFANKQAYWAEIYSAIQYRGQGLNARNMKIVSQFLKTKGITSIKNTIRRYNIQAQKSSNRNGARLVARANYIKLLGWRFWIETPIAASK